MEDYNTFKEKDDRERSAPFNDAVGTLESLREINRMMVLISQIPPSIRRQRLMIDHVKAYFRNSSFLMDDGGKSFEEELNDLDIQTLVRKGRRIQVYSPNLEIKLNDIMRRIQFKIKKYLMPSSKDPRFSWKQE